MRAAAFGHVGRMSWETFGGVILGELKEGFRLFAWKVKTGFTPLHKFNPLRLFIMLP